MGFNIVLYSSTLFFSDSCEFLPSNQYILLNLSPKWLRLYISLPVQLSVEMHTEIFGFQQRSRCVLVRNDHCKCKTKVDSVRYALIIFQFMLPLGTFAF